MCEDRYGGDIASFFFDALNAFRLRAMMFPSALCETACVCVLCVRGREREIVRAKEEKREGRDQEPRRVELKSFSSLAREGFSEKKKKKKSRIVRRERRAKGE